MSFIEGKCPNCGAPLKVDTSKDAAICEFCNTPYVTDKAIIHIHNEAKQDNQYTVDVEQQKTLQSFMKMYVPFMAVLLGAVVIMLIIFAATGIL